MLVAFAFAKTLVIVVKLIMRVSSFESLIKSWYSKCRALGPKHGCFVEKFGETKNSVKPPRTQYLLGRSLSRRRSLTAGYRGHGEGGGGLLPDWNPTRIIVRAS